MAARDTIIFFIKESWFYVVYAKKLFVLSGRIQVQARPMVSKWIKEKVSANVSLVEAKENLKHGLKNTGI